MSRNHGSWLKNGMLAGALAAAFAIGGSEALATDPPVTADVLNKLHESNQKEIEAGKIAQKQGQSKEVRAYGKMLVTDHTAADKKVTGLAKKEKIPLSANEPGTDEMKSMKSGATFDDRFARDMVDDHKKDIAEVTEARNNTTDDQLKQLLSDMLPTLQKHETAAQKIVDSLTKQ
jgi:putative membrane protein